MPLLLLILLLPIAEIAGFILVGEEIGVLATLALILITSALGILLLRIQGIGILSRIRQEAEAGRVPGREMIHGVMIMFAGVLLLLPGFITDSLGLILFIPPVREIGWKLLQRRVVGTVHVQTGPAEPARQTPRVIDLDESEYDRAGPGSSPWRRD